MKTLPADIKADEDNDGAGKVWSAGNQAIE
jgi:hypothetical protein